MRKAAQHSPATFLASKLACHTLCQKFDSAYTLDSCSGLQEARQDLSNRVLPSFVFSGNEQELRQQQLSDAIDERTLHDLKQATQSDIKHQAHLQLVCESGCGQWLHALPNPNLRHQVAAPHFRIMVQRRLRAPIFHEEFLCPFCDETIDRYGDHALTCSCGGDRTKRHNLIRNKVFFFASSSSLNPELEKPGLLQPRPLIGASPEDGDCRHLDARRRPADVFLPRWRRGLPAALDFAVTSGLRGAVVHESSRDASACTRAYEDFKCEHLDTKARCEEEGITFLPVVMEAHRGGWGQEAHKIWAQLAKLKHTVTSERGSTVE